MFKRIGVLGHPLRPATGEVCSDVALHLRTRGIDAWCDSTWDASSIHEALDGTDLIIAIGGDGSMLRAARVGSQRDIPVLGINAGHLGFLTELALDTWHESLDTLLSGKFWIETRMMVHCEAWREGEILRSEEALNDVVVSRGAVAKSILLETYIDGEWTTDFNADGLIIATPTGSTAYALAVGGPILPPTLKNILVVPVAPHLSLDRPLVLSEGATVQVRISPRTLTDAMLTVDGESLIELIAGDAVTVCASQHVSRFIRLRDRNYFYRSLLDRMEPRVPARRDELPILKEAKP